MTLATKHGLYAVSIDSTVLGGITAQNLVTGSDVRSEQSSGEIYARIQALYAQKVAAGFSTRAIASALDACGYTGESIDDMTAGLSLYAQKHEHGASRAAGANHRKFTFNAGILVPRNLSVNHQGDAVLSYDAVITYDGSNDPVVITDSVSLPAGVTDAERFTMGKTTIESIEIAGKRSFSIDFGLDVVGEGADSDIWDTIASIRAVNTVLTLRTWHVDAFGAAGIPLAGKSATHANTTLYLRKRAAGDSFVADATAEHIKITAAGLCHVDTGFDADGNDPTEVTLTMPLLFDGTNAPLIVDTASAIT